LPDARVQPEIADQLLGTGKTLDIANRSLQRKRHHHINARNGHQALDTLVGERRSGEIAFDHFEIVAKPVELAQVTLHRQALVAGQDLLREPGAARRPAQILMRAGRDQMSVQD
jgi:hypothetical protein